MIATVFLTLVSAVVTFYLDSIAGAWKLLLVTGAGTGGVLLLRWYWWRINAWSEVSAMLSAFLVSLTLQTVWHFDTDKPTDFAWLMIITVGHHHRGMVNSDVRDRAGAAGNPARVLSPHPAVGGRLAAHRQARAGDSALARWPGQSPRLGRWLYADLRSAFRDGQTSVARDSSPAWHY